MTTPQPTVIDPVVLNIIVCPRCHGELTVASTSRAEADAELVCDACALAYPVRKGVPVLLLDEALPRG